MFFFSWDCRLDTSSRLLGDDRLDASHTIRIFSLTNTTTRDSAQRKPTGSGSQNLRPSITENIYLPMIDNYLNGVLTHENRVTAVSKSRRKFSIRNLQLFRSPRVPRQRISRRNKPTKGIFGSRGHSRGPSAPSGWFHCAQH